MLRICLGFVYAACLAVFCSRIEAATVLQRWVFDSDHVADGRVVAAHGNLSAEIVGDASLQDDTPALSFDGKGGRVVVASHLEDVNLPKKQFSVEAWCTVDRIQEWGAIVGAIQDNGSYERGWLLGFRKAKFCLGIAGAERKRLTYLTARDEFVPGAWYHIVGTYDGAAMKLFVDGHLAAESKEQSGEILYPPKTWFEIGAYHDDNELYPMEGKIAEITIFDGALAGAEIHQRFEEAKSRFPDVDPVATEVAGWPTYMHDYLRSGVTTETLELPLHAAWLYRARHAPQPAWPPPAQQDFWHNKHGLPARVIYDRAFHVVSDGERVYFASSADDKVYCLDLETGEQRWAFPTEGPVRLAPSIADGKLYFGSDDGCVYCLAVKDGELQWKYRAGESDRRVPGNGRMISTWPVRSGVMAEAGKARFAAGLFPLQGTFQYVLDAKSGKELAKGPIAFSPQGYMQRRGGSVMVSQGRAPSTQLARLTQAAKEKLQAPGKMLDEYPFANIRAGSVQFAGGDGEVAAFDSAGEEIWKASVEGKAYSLAVAGNSLLVSTDQGVIYRFSSTQPTEPKVWNNRDAKVTPPESSERSTAEFVLQKAEVEQGYCLLIGRDTGKLAVELARRTRLQIICPMSDSERIAKARRLLDEAGLAGRVTIHHVSESQLPYGSGLFNLVVCQLSAVRAQTKPAAQEIYRLLVPGRSAALVRNVGSLLDWSGDLAADEREVLDEHGRWLMIRRSPLKNAGQWTHIYASPENTSCSNDQRLQTELELQWFGQPGPQHMIDRHHRTVPPLYVAGRLFVPGNDRVYGVDAYNGTILWNVEVANSRRVAAMRDSGSMAASKEYLYVAAGDRCYGLGSNSGAFELNFPVPATSDGTPRHWGYVAYLGDQLFGSSTQPDASRDGHSRQQINETYFDFVATVTSDSVFSVNRHSGKSQWKYEPQSGAIINPTITIGGGRMYFIESTNPETLDKPSGRAKLEELFKSEADLVSLDIETGEPVWRQPFDFSEMRHAIFLCYSDEKLVAVGTKNKSEALRQFVWYDLHGFQAKTGEHVWSATQNQRWGVNGDHGEQDHHPTIVNGVVYQQPHAYDLHTGERHKEWQFGRGGHGCGALSASASSVFFRAGNPTMCDLSTGKNHKITQVSRPGCWINIIPAGGLLMIPEASSGCTCNFPIQASMVFSPTNGL